jgi:hypothetical protein
MDIVQMLFDQGTIDQDVIEIYQDTTVEFITEDIVHQLHERCWSIAESKQKNYELI